MPCLTAGVSPAPTGISPCRLPAMERVDLADVSAEHRTQLALDFWDPPLAVKGAYPPIRKGRVSAYHRPHDTLCLLTISNASGGAGLWTVFMWHHRCNTISRQRKGNIEATHGSGTCRMQDLNESAIVR